MDPTEHSVLSALETYLRHAEGTSVSVERLERASQGGSTENWLFVATTRDGERRDLVLRRDADYAVIDADRAVEGRTMRAVGNVASVPVPSVVHIESDRRWMGRPFIVMERGPGVADRNVVNSPQMTRSEQVNMARRLGSVLAALHRLDCSTLALPFDSPSSIADHAARELEYWRQMYEAVGLPDPRLTEAVRWLEEHRPNESARALLHGDYRPGNVLVDGGDISAVLDWELAHIGDPMEDLAWYTLPPQFRREHFPDHGYEVDDYLRDYTAWCGIEVDSYNLGYWQLLHGVKLSAIWARQMIKQGAATQEGRVALPEIPASIFDSLAPVRSMS